MHCNEDYTRISRRSIFVTTTWFRVRGIYANSLEAFDNVADCCGSLLSCTSGLPLSLGLHSTETVARKSASATRRTPNSVTSYATDFISLRSSTRRRMQEAYGWHSPASRPRGFNRHCPTSSIPHPSPLWNHHPLMVQLPPFQPVGSWIARMADEQAAGRNEDSWKSIQLKIRLPALVLDSQSYLNIFRPSNRPINPT